jgi:hypothetical protein
MQFKCGESHMTYLARNTVKNLKQSHTTFNVCLVFNRNTSSRVQVKKKSRDGKTEHAFILG